MFNDINHNFLENKDIVENDIIIKKASMRELFQKY